MINLRFKEMVQNAEDAGAKCMKILYDNFSYMVAVSFIGGGNRSILRKSQTCRK
jgi:hypothetical protein